MAESTPDNGFKGEGQDADFTTTNWSLVLSVLDTAPSRSFAALEKLCARYWYPIYAFIRRKGYDSHQAEDLTQSFLQYAIQHQIVGRARRERGRFRNFLLTALVNFLHNYHDEVSAIKRGGKHSIISLDENLAEQIFSSEPHRSAPPDHFFERGWAVTLIRRVADNLRAEHAGRNKCELFEALYPFLTSEPAPNDYEQLAERLSMKNGALRVALHRLRRRFGELLRKEVAYTVLGPEDIEDEIRYLLAVLTRE